ncbi:DUF2339 domain-containing protein [Rhizobacter sp. OV335]|uniref:DUF2339 domain-containing protein n=1 Tax=Rhizobacter sp. OV335 TaxID=1500264 RepID=UPI0009231C03|nr:DUF2339 domain-containing protein [Rhizobacter sp. OV335]SHN14679.1 Uncharacterized membrane protein [Rhizobacter sp. OV335]
MNFVYAVLGGLVGLALGGPVGGLVMLIVTPLVVWQIRKSKQAEAAAPAEEAWPEVPDEAAAAAPVDAAVQPLDLAQRVAALEHEVSALRLQVQRLSGGDATVAVEPLSVPISVPIPDRVLEIDLEPLVDPRSVPAAAAMVEPVVASMAVPVPEAIVPEAIIEPAAAAAIDEPAPAPTWTEPSRANPPPPPPPVEPALPLRDRLPPFLARWIFGGNTIVKVGVLILFLGLAFLLRYVAERATLPVEFRYAGVALVGVVMLVLGWRLRDRRDAAGGTGYGLILQGAGIGVFYLTALAALRLNALLPPTAAFAVMAVVAVLGAALAVLQNAPWLAYVSVAEGFLAPVLVSTGGGNHIALFSYLAVLDVGIFLMAWHKAWRPLNLIGAVGTFTLAGAWAQAHYTDAVYASTQAFLLLFFVLFTVIGVLFARRALALGDDSVATDPLVDRARQALRQVGRVDSALVFGVPLAAFSLQYLMVKDTEWGPAWSALGFAFFYLLIGGGLLRSARIRYALLGEAHVIVGVIFATLAIPLALEGAWTGATWAVEAAGMFWLGVRQHRLYTRAFALAVLAGAVVRLLTDLSIDYAAGTPLIDGSLIGVLLLLGSVLAMWRVHHRHPAAQRAGWEQGNDIALPWLAVGAAALLGWMVLVPLWASVATALLALVLAALGHRFALRVLAACSGALHLVALAGLAASLHLDPQDAPRDGWPGLVAALLVGGSLLATAWLELRAQLRAMDERGALPQWSLASGAALLAGLAVVALGLLCVMPAERAALVWPWLGVGALWLGLRIAHPALAFGWLLLQVGAAVATLAFGPDLLAHAPFGDLRLWLPLGLALTGLLAGDALQRAARPESTAALAWTRQAVVQWGIVGWSLLWWGLMLVPQVLHLLRQAEALDGWPAAMVGCVVASSVLATMLAGWRQWRVLGQATALTLPALVLVALGMASLDAMPSAHLGWLAWPVALLWHVLLLRRQAGWFGGVPLQAMHVIGLWLFVGLASTELALHLADASEPGSAWRVLGWVPVIAAAVFALTRPTVLRRWPVVDFRDAYLVAGAAPLALGLLLWVWAANAHDGTAAPLPYLPLLNPLEIGQCLALLVLALWLRALPQTVRDQVPPAVIRGVLGLSAFAVYTGLVLRLAHHAAGVPWDEASLFESTLTQAMLSVAWSLVGVGLMLLGHRRVMRTVWIAGAGLLGVVVLKLFFVELADQGGLYRIVSFIVVGVLLLVVGYFAPVPPRRAAAVESEVAA